MTKNKNWINIEYKLDTPSTINKDLLKINVFNFWDDIMSKLDINQHANFIFRVKFDNDQIRTINTLKKINKNSKEDLLNYLLSRLNWSNESYNVTPVISMIFSYGIREGKIIPDLINKKGINYQIYYNNKLPIATKPEEYGKILSKKGNQYTIFVNKEVTIILDTQIKNGKKINNIQFFKNGVVIYTWKDKITSDNTFIREIGKSTYHYENNILTLVKVIKKTKPLNITKVSGGLDTRIITMDLETIIINNAHVPYLISWYDGKSTKSYFIESLSSDPIILDLNILNMVNKAMTDICIRKYRGYKVYLHNFSKFDGYFLVKYLSLIGKCNPIINDGKIITLNFYKFNSNYNIVFRDSYLLLPSSLRRLATSFNVPNKKSIFPKSLANLDYIGLLPDIKYFSNVLIEDYNPYKNSFNDKTWNFRDEAIKYCELDCISLYQILSKFNDLIFKRFKLNINSFPTLPSLSFNIFTTHFIKEDNIKSIHMLSGEISKDIRMSYTGGAVDMYIPKALSHTPIYGYDVNSLYPFVMKNFKMPVGNPTYFQGDITKVIDKPFGFFFCNITAPNNLKHPIIQTHIKTSEGIRTVAPLGTWSDMLFSEEMYNAMKFGYTFDIQWGYTFDSAYVFNDFVDNLYSLRLKYPKSDPMNYIAKIILNSLYGRFGMDDNFTSSKIMSKIDYNKFENIKSSDSILDVIEIGDNYLVQTKNQDIDTILDNASEKHNVNVGVSSAIAAYARIHMSQFKNNDNYNLYYSDTDSIYIDNPLNDSFISNTELGKLKLEKVCINSVFLAPKVYGLSDELGNEVIKVKGLTKDSVSNITLCDLHDLLYKDTSLEFNQSKWFRSITLGNISIKEQIYTLKVTGNKRKLIYDNDNNKLINTAPFIINENKEITNKN